jgi:hypothetical protein
MILLPVECLPKDAATQIGATSGVFPIDPRPLPGNKSWQPAGSAEFRISARPVPERAGETLRLFGGSHTKSRPSADGFEMHKLCATGYRSL